MSCVIVSVCSALLVAMNHVTLYIVYIMTSPSASACYVHAHACPRYMCVCARVCVRVYTCTRALARTKSLRLLYCVYFSVCVCVCVTHDHGSMCLRVHIVIIRARRGAIDSEMERSSSYEPLSLPSLVVQHNAAPFFLFFSILSLSLISFFWIDWPASFCLKRFHKAFLLFFVFYATICV